MGSTETNQQFTGSTYGELEEFLQSQLAKNNDEGETPEEIEKKRAKREKRQMFLANIADGLGAFHTAYSYARGVKPMPLQNMTDKARERIEHAKELRDRERERFVNYAVQLARLRDADRTYDFRVRQADQQQNNWQQQFDAGRADRAEDVAFRDKQFDAGRADRAEDVAFRDKQFAEHRRHYRASEGLQRQQLQMSQDGRYSEFYSGDNLIRIPNTRLNAHNISYVFSKTGLPSTKMVTGGNGLTQNEVPLSTEEMMQKIGENLDKPEVQNALRAIGGETSKGAGYGSSDKGKGY